jgi:hypothetical protein
VKQAEFLVKADTEAQVELGVNYALRQIEKGGHSEGEHTIPRFEIKVKWRVIDVVVPTPEEVVKDTILPPVAAIQDVSLVDIEDARGVIAVLSTREELDAVEAMEAGSERFPGGRKGVLHFIQQKRDELDRAEKAEAKAAKKRIAKEAHEAAEAAKVAAAATKVAAKEAKEAAEAAEKGS